jgi:FKBP-type peptidyl-prolyl cis-trans isomerase 2
MKVEKGKKVKVEYTGKFTDGEVFDSSEGREPLEFVAGAGKVIKGFDDAVVGMDINEEKEFTIKPDEAYGQWNEHMVLEIPRDKLPAEPQPEEGMTLLMQNAAGQKMPGKIVEVKEDVVKIDMNHPLAGKELVFNIKVVAVEEDDGQEDDEEEDEDSCGHDCAGCSGCGN